MNYSKLIAEVTPKPVIVVVGTFNPPTNHHQMLIRGAQKVAETLETTVSVYLCRGGLLSEEKQEKHFIAAFPEVSYKKVESTPFPAESTDIYAVGDTLQVFQLSESIELTRVADHLRVEAASGNYYSFKSRLPIGMKDRDGRLLFNDVREALGHAKINFGPKQSQLRDEYITGDLHKVGDTVMCEGEELTIERRGTNYLVCTDSTGHVVQKWLHEVEKLCTV